MQLLALDTFDTEGHANVLNFGQFSEKHGTGGNRGGCRPVVTREGGGMGEHCQSRWGVEQSKQQATEKQGRGNTPARQNPILLGPKALEP